MNARCLPALLFPLLSACGGGAETPASAARERAVYASFEPTAWMARRIAGDLVSVVCPVPEGTDPTLWQPDRDALSALQNAELVILNGAGYEPWAAGASLPPSRTVEAAAGFEDRWLQYEHATTHSHGGAAPHTHAGLDGHTWMDPLLALEEQRAVLEGMCRAFPEHAEAFRANARGVETDLRGLHEHLDLLALRLRAARVLASHPAYNYLARRYKFEVRTFDLDPASELGREERAALSAAMDTGAKNLLLWESPPGAAAAGVPPGIVSVVYAPAERLSAEERSAGKDFLRVMRENAARLELALGP